MSNTSCEQTIGETLATAAAALQRLAEQPKFEAELLLSHAIGKSRGFLRAFAEAEVSPAQQSQFSALLQQRLEGQPIAYILGEREFWSLPLKVAPGVLIPRPDTELLVELALERIPEKTPATVLDLGTGSGAIALAIASERPQAQITAVDQSNAALDIACGNAEQLQLSNVNFIQSDWFSSIPPQRFSVIVSNPPYLAENDPHLRQGDLPKEPRSALVSGPNGDEDFQTLITNTKDWLADDGWLLLEHGCEQGECVRALFATANYNAIDTQQDLAGLDRVTLAQAPRS